VEVFLTRPGSTEKLAHFPLYSRVIPGLSTCL
jgi:hypothetical protein